MYSLYFLLILSVISVSTIADVSSNCHTLSNNYFNYLTTKTGYRFIQNLDDKIFSYPDCELSKIWGIIRHGTRLPGDKIIDKMRHYLITLQNNIIDSFNAGKSKLCDIQSFLDWKPNVRKDDLEKSLTQEGQIELNALGERIKNRFPKLLNQKFNNDTFVFKYTKTQRAQESAFQFVEGIFGREESTEVWYPKSQKRDPILRFYKACDRWKQTVDKNPESYEEQTKFQSSDLFIHLIKQISQRLGFELTADDVILMYTTCSFETAWFPDKQSPWCTIFTDDDFKVLEYNEDIEYYWIDGHGYNLTHNIACVAFQDMYKYLSSTSKQDVVFYFTHSGTLLKILTHLRLYHDLVPLRHDNYHDMTNRKFKVSRIDTFGTNLVFVKFRCNNEDFVLTLHQERPVILPGCQKELCPLKTIEKIYHDSLTNCNFDDMCRLDKMTTVTTQEQDLREDENDHDEL